MVLTIPDLISKLPRGDSFHPKTKGGPPGFRLVPEANPAFVPPDLIEHRPIEAGRTSIILLAAAGALGKSTLAAELASSTGSPLWDLAQVNVGTGTLTGTLVGAYESEGLGVMKRLREGNFLLVMDALDEAQVRAGSENFDTFIQDLAKEMAAPRPRPTVLLLARHEIAGWIECLLDEARVPLARYQIALFDEQRAHTFLDRWLDARRARDRKEALHRQQTVPYAEARTALLDLVYRIFGVSREEAWTRSGPDGEAREGPVKGFLGYAPVLEVLAEFLDVGNYHVLANEIRDGLGVAHDPWEFLSRIVLRILEREATRAQELVRARLQAIAAECHWSDWNRLYQPEEQCSRILGHHLGPASPKIATQLPARLISPYEDALKTRLPDHPFITTGQQFSNVVFKEYVYAWGVTYADNTLAVPLRNAMRSREDPFLPSQMFGYFVRSFGEAGPPVLDGQDFGILYESLLARSTRTELQLSKDKDVLAATATDPDCGMHYDVHLLDTGSGIHIWRRLSNATIDVPGTIQLGFPSQRFTLGPSVFLNGGELVLGSDDFEVDASGNVDLRAGKQSALAYPTKLRVRNETDGRLRVAWPGIGFPWSPHRAATVEPPGVPQLLPDTPRGNALRMLLLIFRRQRTRTEQTLFQARRAPGEARERDELIRLALSRGVLKRLPTRDGVLSFNSDFDSLRNLLEESAALAPAALAFATEFLQSDASELRRRAT